VEYFHARSSQELRHSAAADAAKEPSMTITVSSGVTSSGLNISAGDPLVVLAGGTLEDSTLLSGGSATVSSGGVVEFLVVSSGALLRGPGDMTGEVNLYLGSASGVTVAHNGLLVDNFGSITDVTVENGSVVAIENAGDAEDIAVQSGGIEYIYDGVVSGTEIGGLEFIYGGGKAFADTVESGGVEVLENDPEYGTGEGGFASGTTVLSGGVEQVSLRAVASSTTISAGGVAYVASGGVASDGTVDSGGLLVVSSGGEAPGATVRSGGTVGFGGDVTSDFTAGTVTSATTVSGVTVSSGGILDLFGATVLSGATVSVAAGTVASVRWVYSGASVLGPGELAGGTYVAGSVSGVTLGDSGGYAASEFIILSGGLASDVTVETGGAALDFGSASGTRVSSGGIEAIEWTGAASGSTVLGGGREYVMSGGVTSDDTVEAGALLVVQADATASDVTVQSGGGLDFEGNVTTRIAVGRVASTTVVGGVTVSSGGGIELVGATVLSGGTDTISADGVAERTRVLSGGQEIISSGAAAFSTVVSSGGGETTDAGGAALGLTLLSGGVLVDNGEARFGGAGALDGTLSGSGSIIDAGSLVLSGSGAVFSGKLAIEGGTVELATSAALGTGVVQFVEPTTGSAVLQIDAADAPAAGRTFANTISNFNGANEDIDLRSIAFVSGASATVSGTTLVLSDGGKTYKFNLGGTTAAAYTITSDGQGGTLIDPPSPDPAVARFAQAVAAFASSHEATTALVSSTSPAAQTPFLHVAASASAVHR
jgi:autotransporter passenger strand-loop-strand repeat protein